MAEEQKPGRIELRLEEIGQLFDTLDPFPFRERDLDRDAEDYIVGWAGEFHRDQPIEIVIDLPEKQLAKEEAGQVEAAMARFFNYKANLVGRELRELFRLGRQALAVGAAILAACIVVGRTASAMIEGNVGSYIEESMTILGWVANWRPIEILLYEWWPLARRRKLYRRLAEAKVTLQPIAS